LSGVSELFENVFQLFTPKVLATKLHVEGARIDITRNLSYQMFKICAGISGNVDESFGQQVSVPAKLMYIVNCRRSNNSQVRIYANLYTFVTIDRFTESFGDFVELSGDFYIIWDGDIATVTGGDCDAAFLLNCAIRLPVFIGNRLARANKRLPMIGRPINGLETTFIKFNISYSPLIMFLRQLDQLCQIRGP
jgi:hypothetical protein